MKAASAGMIAHLAGDALTLATLTRIVRRDGLVVTVCDHDRDITYGGETYLSALGYQRAAVSGGSDLAVDETEITGMVAPGSLDYQDIRAGLWDHAAVRLFVVNWADLAQGEIKLRRGTIGEMTVDDRGVFRAEFRGLAQPLQATVGSLYQSSCRAELGDERCGIPLRPPVRANSTAYVAAGPTNRASFMRVNVSGGGIVDSRDEGGAIWECTTGGTSAGSDPGGWAAPAPGDTVTDGTVVWTKRAAWTRPAEIDVVTDAATLVLTGHGIDAYATGWFDGGVAIWESGDNAGVAREVVSWDQGTATLSLFAPPPFAPLVGDVLRVQPGCIRSKARCKEFGNYLNFRGEPFVPGSLALSGTGL